MKTGNLKLVFFILSLCFANIACAALAPGEKPIPIAVGDITIFIPVQLGFQSELDLADLNGQDGFIVEGGVETGTLSNVSGAGDVNNDNFGDIILGSQDADPQYRTNAGQSYVIFGKSSFPAIVYLDDLNGTNGFKLNGGATGDSSGVVSNAGDVNNDGYDDILIGAPRADPPSGQDNGETYLVYGKASFSSSPIQLGSLDGSNGVTFTGEGVGSTNATDLSGYSVSSAGDMNNDNKSDILIGAPCVTANNDSCAGAAYLIFGQSNFTATFSLSSLNGSNGFKMVGINDGNSGQAGARSGTSVSSAGDILNSGYDSIIIGSPQAPTNNTGKAQVIFGCTSCPASIDLTYIKAGTSPGFNLNGASAYQGAGRGVSDIGDINGDNYDDMLIGTDTNTAYVVFGKGPAYTWRDLDLSSLNGSNGFKIVPGGNVLSSAGDVNGDGLDDFIIVGKDTNKTYVVFGRTSFPATLYLDTLNGTNGFVVTDSVDGNNTAAVSVSGAGDINNDGIDDIILARTSSGPANQAYVIFGRDTNN